MRSHLCGQALNEFCERKLGFVDGHVDVKAACCDRLEYLLKSSAVQTSSYSPKMSGGSGTGPFVAHSSAVGLAGGGDPGFARAPSFTTASALARGRTSGHEQDGEIRERSAFTAAGRPRQPQAMPSDTPSVTELLMEQNRLLMQQLQALQTQVSGQQVAKEDQTHSSHEFHEPKQLLEGIDPGLKKVFEDFAKETEHLFAAWATQKTLSEKYTALQSDNKLHPHFQAEASFKWQFTKLYASHAKPVDCEEQMADDDYELPVAWAELRKKHANECFQFVCQHQERCLQVYDNAVSQTSLQLQLSDKVEAWFAEHEFNDVSIKRVMLQKTVPYVESLIRLKRPSIQARMNKNKQIQQKRQQALTDAMTKFESMDVKDVLSPALFELAKLGGSRKKPVTLKDDSALAFLVKDNPELQEKYGLKIVSASAARRRTPTPKRRPQKPSRSPGRSNSASRKPQSILKDPHKQVRFTGNDKGKGKGKDKSKDGKGKGKSKRK